MDIRNSILERCFKRIIRILIEETILASIKATISTDQLKPPKLVPERIYGGKPCWICNGLL